MGYQRRTGHTDEVNEATLVFARAQDYEQPELFVGYK